MEAFRIRDTSYAILFTLVGAFLVTQPPFIFDSAKSTWRNFVGDIFALLSGLVMGAFISLQSRQRLPAMTIGKNIHAAILLSFQSGTTAVLRPTGGRPHAVCQKKYI